jgi:hypothetical protein
MQSLIFTSVFTNAKNETHTINVMVDRVECIQGYDTPPYLLDKLPSIEGTNHT